MAASRSRSILPAGGCGGGDTRQALSAPARAGRPPLGVLCSCLSRRHSDGDEETDRSSGRPHMRPAANGATRPARPAPGPAAGAAPAAASNGVTTGSCVGSWGELCEWVVGGSSEQDSVRGAVGRRCRCDPAQVSV